MSVLLQTSFGDIVIDLYPQRCPNACLNFIKLCQMKHYNNALFAQVQKDYVTQIKTKNPTTIWNQLTPIKQRNKQTQYFKDQLDMQLRMNMLGLVATSNKGSNLNNSQFFITLTKAHLTSLNGKHSVFGKVQEGFQILKKINQIHVDKEFRPQLNIRILHTYILQDPFEDQFKNLKIPLSPKLIQDSDRLEAVQHFQMLNKNKTQTQILEAIRQHKAKKQAVTLQILGDIADADIKPPENILFVCKLNPITQQRDLQIIFSRFGPIKSVEIVRDWKTGTSLQYGFIEFESPNACQQAYMKMENVMIDDRRIHVDFSQSVSKLVPKNKFGKNQKLPKGGQSKENLKDIVPKAKHDNHFYGQKKYNLVGNKPKKQQQSFYKRQESNNNFKKQQNQKNKHIEERKSQKIKQKQKQRQKQKQMQRQRSRQKQTIKKNKNQKNKSRSRQKSKKYRKSYSSQSKDSIKRKEHKHKSKKKHQKQRK